MSDRAMSRLSALALKSLLVGAGAWMTAMSAFAGAGSITTTVTRMSENVTYSSLDSPPLVTYIGYTVRVANGGGNTINNIRFTATAKAGDPAELPTFISAEGASCKTTNAAKTAIDCTIGQLTAGKAFPTFALFFKAPVKADTAPAVDAVILEGVTYYAEGTGGPNSVPQNSTDNLWSPTAPVTLGTPFAQQVKSSVPKSGGSFFTGNGVSTSLDPFATLVQVPGAASYTALAEIYESQISLAEGCVSFTPCYQSAITIPGSFEYLTIVLRQDASTINPGVKIGAVQIFYVGDDWPAGLWLKACTQLNPLQPDADRPCIASSKYYKSKSVPGWTTQLDGDFEWTIITKKNGGYKVGL